MKAIIFTATRAEKVDGCTCTGTKIGNFVHIAPGATLSGGVKVGDNSFIGAGATVIQYKTIGQDCITGAGAVVLEDCLDPGIYIGIPARKTIPESI